LKRLAKGKSTRIFSCKRKVYLTIFIGISAGTNELLLSTALIRYQACMKDVMIAHVELFSQTIEDRVKKETGGDLYVT
jgi:hypothetical protein